MSFEIFCMSMIALLVGLIIAFNGYRLFLVLLPFWGFFFGFGLGAQTIQALFGGGFLATTTSWVVGFVVALVFAVLSYLFYMVAVALFAGSIGYALGVGLMGLIGFQMGFVAWIVGIILAVIVAGVVILFNIQKWVIILLTALGGAGVIIGTFLMVFGVVSPSDLGSDAVRAAMGNSFWWLLGFIVLAVLGFLAQFRASQGFEIEAYENRI
jgi:hypothetical protein